MDPRHLTGSREDESCPKRNGLVEMNSWVSKSEEIRNGIKQINTILKDLRLMANISRWYRGDKKNKQPLKI